MSQNPFPTILYIHIPLASWKNWATRSLRCDECPGMPRIWLTALLHQPGHFGSAAMWKASFSSPPPTFWKFDPLGGTSVSRFIVRSSDSLGWLTGAGQLLGRNISLAQRPVREFGSTEWTPFENCGAWLWHCQISALSFWISQLHTISTFPFFWQIAQSACILSILSMFLFSKRSRIKLETGQMAPPKQDHFQMMHNAGRCARVFDCAGIYMRAQDGHTSFCAVAIQKLRVLIQMLTCETIPAISLASTLTSAPTCPILKLLRFLQRSSRVTGSICVSAAMSCSRPTTTLSAWNFFRASWRARCSWKPL